MTAMAYRRVPHRLLIPGNVEPPPNWLEQEWMTVAEAAAALRVSKMTVNRLIHYGDLPGIQVGRSIRIRKTVFEHYLKERPIHECVCNRDEV